MKSQWIPAQEEFLQAIIPGGGANRVAESLLGIKASNYPPDGITDAAVVAIAESQQPDGGWGEIDPEHRPPIGQSLLAATARIIQALQAYAIPARNEEFAERINRARAWLLQAKAVTTEDVAMRLAGLAYSGAAQSDSTTAASTQFPDGSWRVRSRSIQFQPYFESGFPFGHDQWVSAAATSWAARASGLGIQSTPVLATAQ